MPSPPPLPRSPPRDPRLPQDAPNPPNPPNPQDSPTSQDSSTPKRLHGPTRSRRGTIFPPGTFPPRGTVDLQWLAEKMPPGTVDAEWLSRHPRTGTNAAWIAEKYKELVLRPKGIQEEEEKPTLVMVLPDSDLGMVFTRKRKRRPEDRKEGLEWEYRKAMRQDWNKVMRRERGVELIRLSRKRKEPADGSGSPVPKRAKKELGPGIKRIVGEIGKSIEEDIVSKGAERQLKREGKERSEREGVCDKQLEKKSSQEPEKQEFEKEQEPEKKPPQEPEKKQRPERNQELEENQELEKSRELKASKSNEATTIKETDKATEIRKKDESTEASKAEKSTEAKEIVKATEVGEVDKATKAKETDRPTEANETDKSAKATKSVRVRGPSAKSKAEVGSQSRSKYILRSRGSANVRERRRCIRFNTRLRSSSF